MLFDWITLIAQLVNFLLLVWLLKRYLYTPILNAIDEREKIIATQLHEAESSKAEAEKALENYQQKNAAFDLQRHDLLSNALNEVNSERQKLLEQTRIDVETLRLRLEESLRTEHQNLSSEILRRTRTGIFAIVRKTLADLASVNLEDQIAGVLIGRLNVLNGEEKELFHAALNHSAPEISVRSMFELSLPQQSAIQYALESNLNITTTIKFENLSLPVSGIELLAGGYKISWTIEEYLLSLETYIAELLSEKTKMTTQ